LVHLLKKDDAKLVMVFCNTRRNTDFVANNLKDAGLRARAIHGGMEQAKRIRALKEFADGKMNVIVCTDVAARGLDIVGVSHVYNYDLPKDHRDYIHRIGRTARAGESGIAVNILASRDYDNFSNIQRHNDGMVVRRVNTPWYERIAVKFDEARRSRFGGAHGRTARGRGQSVGGRRSVVGGRGREQRGDRNKRSSGKTGFRGGGRNTSKRRDRH